MSYRENRTGGNSGKKYGKKTFAKKAFGNTRDPDGKPTMHTTICSECGNECEVPFKPRGDKPVFCRNCFRREDSDRGGDRNDRGRKSFLKPPMQSAGGMTSEQFKILNTKLDKILKALE